MRHTLRRALPALASAGLAGIAACASLDGPSPGGSCAPVGTLTVGDTLRDAITTSSCRLTDQTYVNFYRFSVDTQTTLLVTLKSPLQDAFVWVSDSTSLTIGISSATQNPDTVATSRLILKAGSYQLAVNSYGTTPSGSFRVIAAKDSSPVRGCVPVWVTSGITTRQSITAADCIYGPLGSKYYYHLYLYSILGANEVQLTEHSTAFPPEVWVVSQSGATVACVGDRQHGHQRERGLLPLGPGCPAALGRERRLPPGGPVHADDPVGAGRAGPG